MNYIKLYITFKPFLFFFSFPVAGECKNDHTTLLTQKTEKDTQLVKWGAAHFREKKSRGAHTHTHHCFLSKVVLETLWIAVRMIDEIEALVGTSARPTITVTQHPTQFCFELKTFHPLRKIYLLYLDIPIKAETIQTYNPGCCHCHSIEQ